MRPEYVRLVGLQGAIMLTGTVLAYWIVAPLAAKSLLYGNCVVLMSTVLLIWRAGQEKRQETPGVEWALRHAYRTAIERFVWVVIMLGVGFKLLDFAPLWMLAGFIAGQAAWLLLPVWMKFENAK